MKPFSSADLDAFVSYVDNECKGNPNDPRVSDKFGPIALNYKTSVDQSLDPFSEEYFQAQNALYEEISGRPLDQWTGELHQVNVSALLECANPLGSNDVDSISENVRAITSMLSLCSLEAGARILDMGAGHGLSSEIYAFCGCRVSAIDIDPQLGKLATKRAEMRHLSLVRSTLNFDCLSSVEKNAFSAAFFFQSLHHALRPWRLIDELRHKLSDDGVIAFCGEPIQESWWKHWGIRLDRESLFVARKLGWFESGWSIHFIKSCFARNGMELVLFSNGHGGESIGIATKSPEKLAQIIRKGNKLGYALLSDEISHAGKNYHSQIGYLKPDFSRPTIRASANHAGGFMHYGPYISLPSGVYNISFLLRFSDPSNGRRAPTSSVIFDIVSDAGKTVHMEKTIELVSGALMNLVNVQLKLYRETRLIEARVRVPRAGEIWEMSLPVFEAIAAGVAN